MNKEQEYKALLEVFALYCVERMDMADMMDYIHQGMMIRFEGMTESEMIEDIREYAPHLLEEAA